MPWYKVELSWDDITADKHRQLQDAFTALFIANGGPKGAAMVASSDAAEGDTNYFSPRAADIAKSLIVRFGGVECPAPMRSAVDILVASAALEDVPFSPEPTPSDDDDS